MLHGGPSPNPRLAWCLLQLQGEARVCSATHTCLPPHPTPPHPTPPRPYLIPTSPVQGVAAGGRGEGGAGAAEAAGRRGSRPSPIPSPLARPPTSPPRRRRSWGVSGHREYWRLGTIPSTRVPPARPPPTGFAGRRSWRAKHRRRRSGWGGRATRRLRRRRGARTAPRGSWRAPCSGCAASGRGAAWERVRGGGGEMGGGVGRRCGFWTVRGAGIGGERG